MQLKGRSSTGRLRSVHNATGEVGPSHMVGDDKDDLLVKSESVKNLSGRSQDPRGTLAFLRNREMQLGVLSMVLLVFQGTALSLVLRYSRFGPLSMTKSILDFSFAYIAYRSLTSNTVCPLFRVEKV